MGRETAASPTGERGDRQTDTDGRRSSRWTATCEGPWKRSPAPPVDRSAPPERCIKSRPAAGNDAARTAPLLLLPQGESRVHARGPKGGMKTGRASQKGNQRHRTAERQRIEHPHRPNL